MRPLLSLAALAAGANWAVIQVYLWTVFLPGTGGIWPLDARPLGYGEEEVLDLLEAISPRAWLAVTGPMRIADTIFPVALALLVALLARMPGPGPVATAGMALAAAYGVTDLAENAAVARLLDTPLLPDPGLVRLASGLTMAKFALLILAALAAAAAWLRRRA